MTDFSLADLERIIADARPLRRSGIVDGEAVCARHRQGRAEARRRGGRDGDRGRQGRRRSARFGKRRSSLSLAGRAGDRRRSAVGCAWPNSSAAPRGRAPPKRRRAAGAEHAAQYGKSDGPARSDREIFALSLFLGGALGRIPRRYAADADRRRGPPAELALRPDRPRRGPAHLSVDVAPAVGPCRGEPAAVPASARLSSTSPTRSRRRSSSAWPARWRSASRPRRAS